MNRMLPVVALLFVVACDNLPFGTDCTTEARPGITLTVLDSVTTAPISGARVTARRGNTADVPDVIGAGNVFSFAYEKAGTYELTAEKSGYRRWVRENIRVTEDDCHVKTVSLTALLQPQG